MRRIFSFVAAAAIAAVSCNKELHNEEPMVPAGETVTFTASVDGADTKTVLEGNRSYWVNGDAITIHNGTKGFEFSTELEENSLKAEFTYTGNNFTAENGVMAVYPAGDYTADVEAKTVKAHIPTWQQAQAGTYQKDAALAVAYSDNKSLSFRNAAALLKFTVKNENVSHVTFFGNDSEAITGDVQVVLDDDNTLKSVTCLETLTTEGEGENQTEEMKYRTWVECFAWHDEDHQFFNVGETYYIAIAPTAFDEGYGVELKINGVNHKVKSYSGSKELKAGVIYDLGELEYEGSDTPVDTPEWAVAGTFNDWSSTANPMTQEGDYYVVRGVTGLHYTAGMEGDASTTGIKILRNGEWRGGEGKAVAGTWAYVWGDGNNIYVEGASSADEFDIYVNPAEGDYGKYVIVAAGQPMPEDGPAEEPTAQAWYLVGNFNGWTAADANYQMTLDGDWYVFKNFTADGQGIKFVADEKWNVNRGGSFYDVNYLIKVVQGGADMIVKAGTYDVYLSADAKTACFMQVGEKPTAATWPSTYKFYIKNSSNWTNLHLYAWGGYSTSSWPGEKLESMGQAPDGKGSCYYVEIPLGTEIVNFIVNGSGGQTADLTVDATEKLSTGDYFYEHK